MTWSSMISFGMRMDCNLTSPANAAKYFPTPEQYGLRYSETQCAETVCWAGIELSLKESETLSKRFHLSIFDKSTKLSVHLQRYPEPYTVLPVHVFTGSFYSALFRAHFVCSDVEGVYKHAELISEILAEKGYHLSTLRTQVFKFVNRFYKADERFQVTKRLNEIIDVADVINDYKGNYGAATGALHSVAK